MSDWQTVALATAVAAAYMVYAVREIRACNRLIRYCEPPKRPRRRPHKRRDA